MPQWTQRIPGRAFWILLQPDWQINNGFLTGQSYHTLKSWHTVGPQNKDFGAGLQADLTRGLVLSVVQAKVPNSEDTL